MSCLDLDITLVDYISAFKTQLCGPLMLIIKFNQTAKLNQTNTKIIFKTLYLTIFISINLILHNEVIKKYIMLLFPANYFSRFKVSFNEKSLGITELHKYKLKVP